MASYRTLLGGIGFGAALMYVFDPGTGRRRRARVRDKAIHVLHKSTDAVEAISADLTNRTRGLVAEVRRTRRQERVPDDVLVARVRSRMGRVVSHPRAIDVTARDGRVTVRGPVLTSEVRPLLRCVAAVPGVAEVDNKLDVHEHRGSLPGLQGEGQIQGYPAGFARQRWTPTTRLLAGTAGTVLALVGTARRGLAGTGLSLAGLGLLTRAVTNLDARRLFGIGTGHRAVDLQKTLHIRAPVEEVFRFWSDVENFPHFMRNVIDVADQGNGTSRWKVAGPGGLPVAWEAEITEYVENELVAWETTAGHGVSHAGLIRFEPVGEDETRLVLRLSYNPPGGALGHAVASLFGADAKTELDEDLARLKTMIETGRPPHDARKPIAGFDDGEEEA